MNKQSLITYLTHKFSPNKKIDFSQFDANSINKQGENALMYAFKYNREKNFNFNENDWDNFIKNTTIKHSLFKDPEILYFIRYCAKEEIQLKNKTFEYLLYCSDSNQLCENLKSLKENIFNLDNLLVLGEEKIKILTKRLLLDFLEDDYNFFFNLKLLEKSPHANAYFIAMYNSVNDKEAFRQAMNNSLYMDKVDFFKNIIKTFEEQDCLNKIVPEKLPKERIRKI